MLATAFQVCTGLFLAASFAAGNQTADPSPPCEVEQSAPNFPEAGTSEEEAAAFLAALQKAVADDERRQVASMISYPIRAWTGRRDRTFRTAEALLGSYDSVFTPRLRKTIRDARLPCLFTNAEGVMIHDGEVWFHPVPSGGLKIVTINAPIGNGE